jgi:hypothetical protein
MSVPPDKLVLEIEAAEKALCEKLLRLLPAVAKSGAILFTNSHFNPADLWASHFHPEADDLLHAASECVRLRERAELAVPGSVGQLFLAACEEGASNDPNRRGPRRLAEALLAQLE